MYAVLYTISIRTATIPLEGCFLGYLRGDSLLVARCQMAATLFPFFFRLILWGHFALKIFTSCLWNRKLLPGKEKSIGQWFLSVSRAKILEPDEERENRGESSFCIDASYWIGRFPLSQKIICKVFCWIIVHLPRRRPRRAEWSFPPLFCSWLVKLEIMEASPRYSPWDVGGAKRKKALILLWDRTLLRSLEIGFYAWLFCWLYTSV